MEILTSHTLFSHKTAGASINNVENIKTIGFIVKLFLNFVKIDNLRFNYCARPFVKAPFIYIQQHPLQNVTAQQ